MCNCSPCHCGNSNFLEAWISQIVCSEDYKNRHTLVDGNIDPTQHCSNCGGSNRPEMISVANVETTGQ